jgi:hypothetical protein
VLGSHDVIYLPSDRGRCPTCGAALFAVVRSYFDTGEPIQDTIHVGCANCDSEIGGSVTEPVRRWICDNYRVKA